MPHPILLCTMQWTDLSLEELAQKAGEWGYQGLDLACWGDHFEVQRALSENNYCQKKLDLLARHDLAAPVLSSHRVSQAVGDVIDKRHRAILPDYVWGDGNPKGVRQRAAEEMTATIQAAQKMGVGVLAGFGGSTLWSYVTGFPGLDPNVVEAGLQEFARAWNPILDVCRDCGLKYALEVHPGQIAFDLFSAEMTLDALQGREEFGFLFDPSHLHWQGIDPVEFLRRFPERIFHVHVKDAMLTLNGRSGLLNSYLPPGDPRRGWDERSPGHGGIDWEAIIRGLNEIGYDGPLAIEWKDSGMDREYGAEDACNFVKRLDFDLARPRRGGPFS
jgi:sugar phosphate isomerase/epimerase